MAEEEIITPSRSRKKRKIKGSSSKRWEKLRERRVLGIDTLSSGSLVSADIPANNIPKPPSNPGEAGHTVTGFGGGIIPGVANGGLSNPAPTFTKALPRIGRLSRRTINSAEITGDQNPMTRVDANNNGLIFDGTWREMPDPTPGKNVTENVSRAITGAMARERNADQYVGTEKVLADHFAQARIFDAWEKAHDWNAFHRNHFDWWMFPIPRGSNSYEDAYNIAGEPLEELKQNPQYMQTLKNAMRQYMLSLGWDSVNNKWVDSPEILRGQTPRNNINSARLYKIGQSAEAHGLNNELKSVTSLATELRDVGYRVGNDAYWDKQAAHFGISGKMADGRYERPDYNDPKLFPQNLHKSDRGKEVTLPNGEKFVFSGSHESSTRGWIHASVWIDKIDIPNGKKKGETIRVFARDGKTEHVLEWDGGEWKKKTFKKGATRKSSGGASAGLSIRALKRDGDITTTPGSKQLKDLLDKLDAEGWDWRNEDERLSLVDKIKNSQKDLRGYQPWAHGEKPSLGYKQNPYLDELWSHFAGLGLYTAHNRQGGHGKIGNAFIKWKNLASTPSDINTNASELSGILSELDDEKNPNLFNLHFEHWIRDPLTTVKDPRDGKQKGIRYVFGNDREKMLAEYKRRIAQLRNDAFTLVTGKPENENETTAETISPEKIVSDLRSENPALVQLLSSLVKSNSQSDVRSMDRLHYLVMQQAQMRTSTSNLESITSDVLQTLAEQNDSSFAKMMKEKNPTFFDKDILPEHSNSEVEDINNWADLLFEEHLTNQSDAQVEQPEDFWREQFTSIGNLASPLSDEQIDHVMHSAAERHDATFKGVVGQMSSSENSVEATYNGYNKEDPTSLTNHMLSPESSYDVRPKPVSTIEEARKTGAPVSWLIPGSYPPQLEEALNDIVDEVADNGWTSIEDFRESGTGKPDVIAAWKARSGELIAKIEGVLVPLWYGKPMRELVRDRDLTDDEQMLVHALTNRDATTFSEAQSLIDDMSDGPMKNILHNEIKLFTDSRETHLVAMGLVQRAVNAGIKANWLAQNNPSGGFSATEETLDDLGVRIASALNNNGPDDIDNPEIQVAISMPIDAASQMFSTDGIFKTLFDTGKSKGNSDRQVRELQEFTSFGYLPSYRGPRPIYGTITPHGLTEKNLDATHHYGVVKLVLRPSARQRATWTESDSLSLTSTASSLENPSMHGLFAQKLKGDLLSFSNSEHEWGHDWEKQTTPFQFAEAQIHGGLSTADIAYIVVDDRNYNNGWYGESEWPAVDANGNEITDTDYEHPEELEDYPPFAQISRIAESSGIKLIRASEYWDKYEADAIEP